MKELPASLVVLRAARGLKQGQVADLAGTTRSNLCGYECGRLTPRLMTLSKILEALGFTLADLAEAAAFVARLKERK